MTLDDRAAHYHVTFPKYPQMWVDGGWLMGIWVLGNLYKKASPYYGAFPGNFRRRVDALFPDKTHPLHLFSGTLVAGPGETTVDCQVTDEVRPTVVADARRLPFAEGSFDFCLADPPYSAADASHYATPMISRRHIMHEVRRVMTPGGYLAWLDTVRPMYSSKMWKQVGAVGVLVSTNTRVRCLSVFEAV